MTSTKKYSIIIVSAFVISWFIKPPVFSFLILGSLVFCFGVVGLHFLSRLQKKGTRCTGRILAYPPDGNGSKTPVVEFTINGNLIRESPYVYSSTDLSKIRSYKKMIDKEVSILYDPDDPKKFILAGDNIFNYFVLIFVTLGGLFFIILSISSLLGYIKFS